jgi:alpha-L-arabinofuranosidase
MQTVSWEQRGSTEPLGEGEEVALSDTTAAVPISLALIGADAQAVPADREPFTLKVSIEPMHEGRISPMLYGGFIELLDDLVPGMWAEMLNDRSFEGVIPAVNWCYYTGEPNFCDREWDQSDGVTRDGLNPFNGTQSARLRPSNARPAFLRQHGLAVRWGMSYAFSGYLRTDSPDLEVIIRTKSLLPSGNWAVLCEACITALKGEWTRHSCRLLSVGTSDRVVFEIEARGSGSLWVDKVSLMPTDNIEGWRKDVVEAVGAQLPGVIRWGGSVIDPGDYKWKEGIGDRDLRTPFFNKYWGRLDSNDVGIDEFLQFCEAVEVAPLVCVSFSDGPESARDLVQYCNGDTDTPWGKRREENGHPDPYEVKYWQVGNELAGEEYVKGCVAICEAIKAEDPTAVILSSYPSPELFETVGQCIDFTCPHYYTPDIEGVDQSLQRDKEAIRMANVGHEIKIGMTEWNITAGGWGIPRAEMATLKAALHAARYLNVLRRHSDIVEMACRSNMTNSYHSGMIQTNPAGLLKTPGYYTMKLFAENSKRIPVVVEGVSDGLDITACRTEEGGAVCVFAVNTSLEPIAIRLDLRDYGSDFTPSRGEAVCDTLDRRQPDIMNHWEAPGRVKTVSMDVSGETITLPALSVAVIECSSSPATRR